MIRKFKFIIFVSIIFFGITSIGRTEAICDRSLNDEQGISYFEFYFNDNNSSTFDKKYYGYHRDGGYICSLGIYTYHQFNYKQISKDEYCNPSIFSKHIKYIRGNSHQLIQSKYICSAPSVDGSGLETEVEAGWSINHLDLIESYEATDSRQISSSVTNKSVCLKATKSNGSSFQSLSSSSDHYVVEAISRGFNIETCNQLTGRGKNQTVTHLVVKAGEFCKKYPDNEKYCTQINNSIQIVDKTAPVLDVDDRITVTDRTYFITGRVSDDSDVFVLAEGILIPVKNNKFTIQGSSSIGIKEYEIIAFDKWGNETIKNIIVERIMQTVSNASSNSTKIASNTGDIKKYCSDGTNNLQKKIICNGPGEYEISKNEFCTRIPSASNLESMFWYAKEYIRECEIQLGLTTVNSELKFCKHLYNLHDSMYTLDACARFFNLSTTQIALLDLETGPSALDIASSVTNKFVCLRATKSDGSSFESRSSSFGNYVEEARNRDFNLESCNTLTGRGNITTTDLNTKYIYCLNSYGVLTRDLKSERNSCFFGNPINPESFCKDVNTKNRSSCEVYGFNKSNSSTQTITQTAQVPKTKVDKTAPVLDVEDRILVNQIDYSISGQVSDESKVFIEVNGNSVNIVNNTFKIEGSTPIGLNEVELVAFDEWGNKTSKKIIIDRVIETADSSYQFEDLNPYKLKSKTNKNKLALVIGIEKYESIPNANFADRDAKLFIDYVQRGLGVPENKIKFFFNEDAKERSKFEMVKWLKKNINSKSEVYLYFSGHGLATNKGQDLYLLANDTITDFIEETAINRNEIFNAVAANNPKSVTAFLDTCYSGAGRTEGETLLAMAKGLVVVDEQQQQLPDNFTLFTAASAQESAWSLPEAQHGTFSYFLMKGMEGEADLDGDNKLTNGELQEYLLDNVSRYAQQQQTPQMIGDPDQVLVRF